MAHDHGDMSSASSAAMMGDDHMGHEFCSGGGTVMLQGFQVSPLCLWLSDALLMPTAPDAADPAAAVAAAAVSRRFYRRGG